MDWALVNLCCSARQYKGIAALIALDTASQIAIKRKHRMLSSLEPEHTESISSTSLCYAAKGTWMLKLLKRVIRHWWAYGLYEVILKMLGQGQEFSEPRLSLRELNNLCLIIGNTVKCWANGPMPWEEIKFSLQNSDEVTGTRSNVNTPSVRAVSTGAGEGCFPCLSPGIWRARKSKKVSSLV